jgi:Ni/Co efflux regulator RcnB
MKRLGDKTNRERERERDRDRERQRTRNGKRVEKPDMFSMANAWESHQVETGRWQAELVVV